MIMKINVLFKNIILIFLNIIFRVLWIFPEDKKKVFFISYHGNQYSCSPKCVSEFLNNKHKDIRIIWHLKKLKDHIPKEYNIVNKKSFSYYKNLMTSKVIIHNVYIPPWLPYRKGQIIINTWHGGSLGKLPYQNFDNLSFYNKKLLRERTDYFLSSSKAFSEYVLRGTFEYQGTIIECGLPRNDIFFKSIKDFPVHNFYGISKEKQVLLYAPTYRDRKSRSYIEPDYIAIKEAWEKKNSCRAVILVRIHPLSNWKVIEDENIFDGGRYDDMQDILRETDCLITDYSSSVWDYCITDKPCILYTPDLEEYESNRKVYMSVSNFRLPLARTNEELLKIILSLNKEAYMHCDRMYKELLGSFESGTATEQVSRLIEEKMGLQ